MKLCDSKYKTVKNQTTCLCFSETDWASFVIKTAVAFFDSKVLQFIKFIDLIQVIYISFFHFGQTNLLADLKTSQTIFIFRSVFEQTADSTAP